MTKGTRRTQSSSPSRPREALQRPADDLVLVGDRAVRGRAGEIRVWSIDSAR